MNEKKCKLSDDNNNIGYNNNNNKEHKVDYGCHKLSLRFKSPNYHFHSNIYMIAAESTLITTRIFLWKKNQQFLTNC